GLAWFGIYQARANLEQEMVLVKLSYFGAASRAEFPLNTEFAKISNNSTVGLTGQARVINDVAAYLQQGGEYYTCDPKVKAEACLPLFAQSGKIVGIIDAEDLKQQVFTAEALALLVAVCLSIPECLPAIA
ncbi:histidine kinase, partial [Alishewanella sp. SMS9]|nr:histidine kinase [Alishewanella sp. SMS9]